MDWCVRSQGKLEPPVSAPCLAPTFKPLTSSSDSRRALDFGAVWDLRPCRDVDSDGRLQLGSPRSMLSMKRFGSLRKSRKRKEQDGLSARPRSEASCLCGNHNPRFDPPLSCARFRLNAHGRRMSSLRAVGAPYRSCFSGCSLVSPMYLVHLDCTGTEMVTLSIGQRLLGLDEAGRAPPPSSTSTTWMWSRCNDRIRLTSARICFPLAAKWGWLTARGRGSLLEGWFCIMYLTQQK